MYIDLYLIAVWVVTILCNVQLSNGHEREDIRQMMKSLKDIKKCFKAAKSLQKDLENELKILEFSQHCEQFLKQIKLTELQRLALSKVGFNPDPVEEYISNSPQPTIAKASFDKQDVATPPTITKENIPPKPPTLQKEEINVVKQKSRKEKPAKVVPSDKSNPRLSPQKKTYPVQGKQATQKKEKLSPKKSRKGDKKKPQKFANEVENKIHSVVQKSNKFSQTEEEKWVLNQNKQNEVFQAADKPLLREVRSTVNQQSGTGLPHEVQNPVIPTSVDTVNNQMVLTVDQQGKSGPSHIPEGIHVQRANQIHPYEQKEVLINQANPSQSHLKPRQMATEHGNAFPAVRPGVQVQNFDDIPSAMQEPVQMIQEGSNVYLQFQQQLPTVTPQKPNVTPQIPIGVPQIPIGAPQIPIGAPQIPIGALHIPIEAPQMPNGASLVPTGAAQIPAEAPQIHAFYHTQANQEGAWQINEQMGQPHQNVFPADDPNAPVMYPYQEGQLNNQVQGNPPFQNLPNEAFIQHSGNVQFQPIQQEDMLQAQMRTDAWLHQGEMPYQQIPQYFDNNIQQQTFGNHFPQGLYSEQNMNMDPKLYDQNAIYESIQGNQYEGGNPHTDFPMPNIHYNEIKPQENNFDVQPEMKVQEGNLQGQANVWQQNQNQVEQNNEMFEAPRQPQDGERVDTIQHSDHHIPPQQRFEL